jgi:hypothetical protein
MSDAVFDTAKKRHEVIFDAYIQLMSELGNQAKHVSKKSMYDEVAKRTNYSQEYVSKIITKKFRENNGDRATK